MEGIGVKNNKGRHGLWRNLQKMSSANVLDSLFQRLPIVRNDSGFGWKLMTLTMLWLHVK